MRMMVMMLKMVMASKIEMMIVLMMFEVDCMQLCHELARGDNPSVAISYQTPVTTIADL